MATDDEITSDELDGLLGEAETLSADRPDEPTQMQLYVIVGADTWHQLEQRAAQTGAAMTDAAADALRAGAHAA